MSMDSFDNENLITRPFAKALMQETNVSVARVGPIAINELGYFTFGGQGYDPQNTPTVEVRDQVSGRTTVKGKPMLQHLLMA